MGVLDTLGGVTAARRTAKIITDEALHAEWLELNAQLSKAADDDVKGGSPAMSATKAAAAAMEKRRDEIEASRVAFEFERLDWLSRVNLQAEHPPRQGNPLDAARGFNVETFTPALIQATCVRAIDASGDAAEVPPELWERLLVGKPDEGIRPLLGYLQVEELFSTANWVEVGNRLPPSARSLLETKDSGASSAQPGPGTSAQSGSEGGSRRTSRRSTATKKAASSA